MNWLFCWEEGKIFFVSVTVSLRPWTWRQNVSSKRWYSWPKLGLYVATALNTQTLKSQGQTSFSSYSSRASVVMHSNRRGLVSSVSVATLVMSIHCCYFVKNWRNACFAICQSNKDRDMLIQKGNNCVCFPRTELRSGTFRCPCRPQNNIRFPRVGGSVWRCAGIPACKGYNWIDIEYR